MISRKNGVTRSHRTTDKFFHATVIGDLFQMEKIISCNNIDVNQKDNHGKSLLFHAISTKKDEIVDFAIRHKCDVNLTSFVSYRRELGLVELLSCDEPPVVTAARLSNNYAVKKLLEAGAYVNGQTSIRQHDNLIIKDRTALHIASESINLEVVTYLLDFDADVNIEDKGRETAVHKIVRCRECPVQSDILKLLGEKNADTNHRNKLNCTPMYLASFYGCLKKVGILLDYGADVDIFCERDVSFGTSLHVAAGKDHNNIAKLLIQKGADMNIRNGFQCTPLHLNINSFGKSPIAEMLIYHGCDLTSVDKWKKTLLAACIKNLRLDCETLTKLLVYAGYNLKRDKWLKQEANIESCDTSSESDENVNIDVPIPQGRVQRLCDWLLVCQQNPLPLQDICRIQIRQHVAMIEIGKSIVGALEVLPLPKSLRDYVQLKDLVAQC